MNLNNGDILREPTLIYLEKNLNVVPKDYHIALQTKTFMILQEEVFLITKPVGFSIRIIRFISVVSSFTTNCLPTSQTELKLQ